MVLHAAIGAAAQVATEHSQSRLLVVLGRSRRMAAESHTEELQVLLAEKSSSLSSEVLKTLGDVGSAFVTGNVNASLVILQAFLS